MTEKIVFQDVHPREVLCIVIYDTFGAWGVTTYGDRMPVSPVEFSLQKQLRYRPIFFRTRRLDLLKIPIILTFGV